MIYVIYGALGAVYTIALLLLGGWAGYRLHALLQTVSLPPKGAGQSESEERNAFEEMLRYNLATAYGMDDGGDSL